MAGVVYWFIRTATTYDVAVPAAGRANQEQFNRDVSYAFSGLIGGYGVAGQLTLRASPLAIPQHILCDGAALQRAAYPELYEAIGTEWGAGDGATTFNVPTQAGVWGFAAAPATPPVQVVDNTTVSSGSVVTNPTDPGQTGGTSGGVVDSGGRFRNRPIPQ